MTAPAEHVEHAEHEGSFYHDRSGGAVFLFFSVFLGLIARQIARRTHIPYTVLLIVMGVILGGLEHGFNLGALEESSDKFVDTDRGLNPHLILLVFLPALIFGSSFSVDFHIISRELAQILLLAVPGVAISALLTGVFATYALDVGSFGAAGLTFGAMMSATDPVAVVALLRELGASKRLSLLIEGESLFNDGTSLVLFTVFRDRMRGETVSIGDGIASFVRLSFGGCAFGLVAGWIGVYMLSKLQFDRTSQITLTLFLAYGTFVFSESTALLVSGLLAVVVVGLTLAASGETRIRDHEGMHAFWETIEYIANTVIFVIAGVAIYQRGFRDTTIGSFEVGMLFVLYLFLHVVRAIVVFILKPLINYRAVYHVTTAECSVLAYAGLRGAVGLLLALTIAADPGIQNESTKDKFVFYMCGIALLTLLVNGSTCGLLIRWLGLAKPSVASAAMFQTALGTVEEHLKSVLASLRNSAFVGRADWKHVNRFMPRILRAIRRQHKIVEKRFAEVSGPKPPVFLAHTKSMSQGKVSMASMRDSETKAEVPPVVAATSQTVYGCSGLDLVVEVRRRFLNLVKRQYWQLFHAGRLSGNAVELLVDAASSCQDQLHRKLHEWTFVEPFFSRSRLHGLLSKALCCVSGPRGYLHSALAFEYELAAGFSAAHRNAMPFVRGLFPAEEALCNVVLTESLDEVQLAERQAETIVKEYREIARSIQTRFAVKALVKEADNIAHKLLEDGYIDHGEYEAIQECVVKSYHRSNLPIARLDEAEELRALGFLAELNDETFKAFMDAGETRLFHDKNCLLEEGKRPDGFYLVMRGTVIVYSASSSALKAHTVSSGETKSGPPVAGDSEVIGAGPGAGAGAGAGAGVGAGLGAGVGDSGRIAANRHPTNSSLAASDVEQLLIGSGGVLVDRLGRGDMIGVLSMLTNDPQRVTACALGPVMTFFVPHRSVWRMLKSSVDPEGGPSRVVSPLEEVVCRNAGSLAARLRLPEFQHMAGDDIRPLFEKARLVRPIPYTRMVLNGFGVLLTGTMLQEYAECPQPPAPTIPPDRAVPPTPSIARSPSSLVQECDEYDPAYGGVDVEPHDEDVILRAPGFFDPIPDVHYKYGPDTRILIIPMRHLDQFLRSRNDFAATVLHMHQLQPRRAVTPMPFKPPPLYRAGSAPADPSTPYPSHPAALPLAQLRSASMRPAAARQLLRQLSDRGVLDASANAGGLTIDVGGGDDTGAGDGAAAGAEGGADDAARSGAAASVGGRSDDAAAAPELVSPLLDAQSEGGVEMAPLAASSPVRRGSTQPMGRHPLGFVPPLRKSQSERARDSPARLSIVASRASVVAGNASTGTVTPLDTVAEQSMLKWSGAGGELQQRTLDLASPATAAFANTPHPVRRRFTFARRKPAADDDDDDDDDDDV